MKQVLINSLLYIMVAVKNSVIEHVIPDHAVIKSNLIEKKKKPTQNRKPLNDQIIKSPLKAPLPVVIVPSRARKPA